MPFLKATAANQLIMKTVILNLHLDIDLVSVASYLLKPSRKEEKTILSFLIYKHEMLTVLHNSI